MSPTSRSSSSWFMLLVSKGVWTACLEDHHQPTKATTMTIAIIIYNFLVIMFLLITDYWLSVTLGVGVGLGSCARVVAAFLTAS